jgi:hypothetical protein
MMRFRGSGRGFKRRRPSSVNRIDLPDFIPLERIEPIQSHHTQNRNQNFHNPAPFQDNRKTNNQKHNNNNDRYSEERHHQNRRENSGSMERQKRKHSPITHHPSSSQPTKYRSKSPKNLKVIAHVGNHRKHNASFSEYDSFHGQYGQHSQHEELRQKRSPIVFDLNDPRRHSMNESNGHPVQMPSTSNQQIMAPECSNKRSMERDNILVSLKCRAEYRETPSNNTNNVHEDNDILDRLETLERDKKQLLVHCNGLRDTVDQYYREISKLEALIHTFSQEIEIIKRRIYN